MLAGTRWEGQHGAAGLLYRFFIGLRSSCIGPLIAFTVSAVGRPPAAN